MNTINVAAMNEVSGVVGPGRFLVVWVQGCLKRCVGCVNADYLPMVDRRQVTPEEVAAQLHDGLSGVCFSGGEPFLQADAIVQACRLVHDRGYGTVCYSGYTLSELRDECLAGARRLLAELDILIDGEYVQALKGNYLWRGSANQQIHFLTERFTFPCPNEQPAAYVRIDGAQVTTVGVPNPALGALLRQLKHEGVLLRSANPSS